MEFRGAAPYAPPLKPTPQIFFDCQRLFRFVGGRFTYHLPISPTTKALPRYIYETANFVEPNKPAIMTSMDGDPAEHDSVSTNGLADMEDEDLFEINLEAVNSIPPPHYWDSYFTTSGSALLANCLLPISDVSGAVPIVSKDVPNAVPMVSKSSNVLSLAGAANLVVVAEPMPLGELLRLPFLAGAARRPMKA